MRILQFCHKPPYPPHNGGSIAMNNITQGLLNEGHEVMVFAIASSNHPLDDNLVDEAYRQRTNFQSVFVDTTPQLGSAVKAYFHDQAYRIQRYYSRDVVQRLMQILSAHTFDIIQLETPFTTPYIATIRKYSKAKIVLHSHKIEYRTWERIAKQETNLFRKLLLQWRIKSLQKFERTLGKRVDACITMSDLDYQSLSHWYASIPCQMIPFGLNLDEYEVTEPYIPTAQPTLFNLSSVEVLSNREGLQWFLDDVWPPILEKFPELKFYVAGRNIADHLDAAEKEGVTLVGEVSSANEFMQAHDLMIVPLLSSNGVQVKIVEGMAMGKTIITTTIGAESMQVENGKQLLVADTPEEFIAAIEKCIQTPDLCAFIGENARNFVALNHNNELIIKQLIDFYNSLLAR